MVIDMLRGVRRVVGVRWGEMCWLSVVGGWLVVRFGFGFEHRRRCRLRVVLLICHEINLGRQSSIGQSRKRGRDHLPSCSMCFWNGDG